MVSRIVHLGKTIHFDKTAHKEKQFVYKYLTVFSTDKKVSKGAKIRNRYNQVPYLTQDTNGKVTNSQLDTTNNRQEV